MNRLDGNGHLREVSNMASLTSCERDFVAHVAGFDGLRREIYERVIAASSIARHGKRQSLFRQGDSATAFFVILQGWVKLYRITATGDEAIIDVATRGASLAVVAALTREPHSATAEAVSDACVVRIPVIHVERCMREMPEVTLAVMGLTFRQMHRAAQQIEQLKTKSALQRVAEFVAALCPAGAGPCVAALPYNKLLIAGYLGITPESLSRTFAKLKCIGVSVHASHVAVSDVGRLRQLAGDEQDLPYCGNRLERQIAETTAH
jgi:CRP-like cAMP-binding protein